jgi:uncharacterized damage-inducible protein DinB
MQYLVDLFKYTTWADDKLIQAAQALPEATLDKEWESPSLKSIRKGLVHMVGASWAWLERFHGRSPAAFPKVEAYPDLASMKTHWDQIHAGLEAYAAGLDEARFGGMLTYRTTEGLENTQKLALLVLHCVNHSTEHRTTLSAFCALSGSDPGDLSILTYLRRAQ